MRIGIFDLETFSLHANTGILLCGVVKPFGDKEKVKVWRADHYPTWDKERSNSRAIVKDVVDGLMGKPGDGSDDAGFDLLVAHNGLFFDRPMLATWAMKYQLPQLRQLVTTKLIDPCQLSRRKLRLARNSQQEIMDYMGVRQPKTHVKFEHWRKAAFDGNRQSMNYIVDHCVKDVLALEAVYKKFRKLVKEINDSGSSR